MTRRLMLLARITGGRLTHLVLFLPPRPPGEAEGVRRVPPTQFPPSRRAREFAGL